MCLCMCVCVFLLILGDLFSTQRALQHSGCQGDDQRVAPQPTHTLTHTHPAASGLPSCKRSATHMHTQAHTSLHTSRSFIVYKPEWILIVLNRAFTTQMLFLGLSVHPHTFSPMIHTSSQHTHTHTAIQKQAAIH